MRKLIVVTIFLAAIVAMPFVSTGLASAASNQTMASANSLGSPDILVNPVQGPSVGQRLASRTKTSWPWYITRAAGLVAAVSLTILLLSGVGLITGATFKFLEPLTAWATHRAVGIVFAVSSVLHIGALLFDKFVPFSILQIFVPFASKYRQVSIAGHKLGSLYVALGIFAFYAALALVLTSYFWMDKKPKIWKTFHFLAYFIVVLVFFHALFLGTDLAHGIFRILWIVFGCLLGIAIAIRLRRARAT